MRCANGGGALCLGGKSMLHVRINASADRPNWYRTVPPVYDARQRRSRCNARVVRVILAEALKTRGVSADARVLRRGARAALD